MFLVFLSSDFFRSAPACTLHSNHSQTCNLWWRQSAQAQQTQKNRYQEANSRWCNVTSAKMRAAGFLNVARADLSAPCEIVDSERLFSAASHLLEEKWNRPTCDNAEMLIFVKNSKKTCMHFWKDVSSVQDDYFYFT